MPALGSLAAEPLYILVDTAIVGHLGREQLAALGISAVVLGTLFAIFNFLQYGTTAQVGRASGPGQERAARQLGGQALWLCLAVGVGLTGVLVALAPAVVAAMGGEGQTADYAVTYLRIVSLGLPFAFIAIGAQGYLRGVADLRTPLRDPHRRQRRERDPRGALRLRLRLGHRGVGVGNGARAGGMGVAFVVTLVRSARGDLRPRTRLMLRLSRSAGTSSSGRPRSWPRSPLAGAIVTRFGDASIAAHQIAFQLWIFLALVLDAIAIAGQVLVGRGLGAGDTERAYAASIAHDLALRLRRRRVRGGAARRRGVLPYAFTSDELVVERTQAIWLLFVLMQPLNGAVFALDGILIGASDGPFLAWSMVAAFVVVGGRRAGGARVRLGDRRRLVGPRRADRRPAGADVLAVLRTALARHGWAA